MNNYIQRVYVCDNVLTSTVRQRVSSSPGYSNHPNQKQCVKMERRGPLNDIQPNLCNADTKYANNVNYLCAGVQKKEKSKSASQFKEEQNYYKNNIQNGYYMEAGPSCAIPNNTDKIKYVTVRNAPPSENDLRSFSCDESDDEDDVFYVAEKKAAPKKLSPILKNKATDINAVITSPVVKKISRKKSQVAKNQTSSKLDIVHVFGRLHNKEYIFDNITYLVSNENDHLVDTTEFQAMRVNINARAIVIDWLIKIQDQLSMTRITFLQTVRLFDHILTSTNVAINMYQLVAITCYWILSKFNDPVYANAKTILILTGGAYSRAQLRNMELKIFDYMNCKCNIVDPSAFLEYYIICSGVQNKNVLLASYYMLESMTISPYFSTISPSLLALSSFYLAARTLKEEFRFLRKLQRCQAYYEYEETALIQQRIWKVLERVITKKIPFQACYNKHSTIEYNFISFVITKALTSK